MKTLTDLKADARITLPQESITFSGPPDLLIGQVIFENAGNEDFQITHLPLEHEKLEQMEGLRFDGFQVNSDLKAGQKLFQTVSISLDPHTPAATHEMDVLIGGIRKKIRLIIQPNIEIEISPGEIYLLGTTPGTSHRAEVQVYNHGNVPVDLPSGVYETELTHKNIISCLIQAVKESSGKPARETLESFVENMRQELENGLEISFGKQGQILNPGESATLQIIFTLPAKIKVQEKYEGSIEIFNDKLIYKIFGSPKPGPASRLSKKPVTNK